MRFYGIPFLYSVQMDKFRTVYIRFVGKAVLRWFGEQIPLYTSEQRLSIGHITFCPSAINIVDCAKNSKLLHDSRKNYCTFYTMQLPHFCIFFVNPRISRNKRMLTSCLPQTHSVQIFPRKSIQLFIQMKWMAWFFSDMKYPVISTPFPFSQ